MENTNPKNQSEKSTLPNNAYEATLAEGVFQRLFRRFLGPKNIAGPDPRFALYFMFLGIILILISIICGGVFHGIKPTIFPYRFMVFAFLYHATRDFGIGIFSAGLIAWLLEMRNFVEYTKQAVTSVIKDTDILEDAFWKITNDVHYLEKQDLKDIKLSTQNTRKAYLKKKGYRIEDHSVASLMDFEDKILESIYEPFYEKYRVTVECHERKLNEIPVLKHLYEANSEIILIEKKVHTIFTLVNPSNHPYEHPLKFQVNLHCPLFIKGEDISSVCKFNQFFYRIDDGKQVDISNKIQYKRDENYSYKKGPHPELYNTQFVATPMENDFKLTLHYKNKLQVEFYETRYVMRTDAVFRRRLFKPSKFTMLSYEYKKHETSNYEIELSGDCIGTLLESQDCLLIEENKEDNRLNIEIDAWMLAGNGIFVMHNFLSPELAKEQKELTEEAAD